MPVFIFLRKTFFLSKILFFVNCILCHFYTFFLKSPYQAATRAPFSAEPGKGKICPNRFLALSQTCMLTKKSPSQAGELYMGPSTLQFARQTCKNAGEMLFLFRQQRKMHGFGLFLSCPPSHMSAQTLHLLDLQLEVLVPSTRPFKECETEVVD